MKLLVFFTVIGIAIAQFPNYSPYQPFGSTTQAPRYQPFGSNTQAPRYQPFGSTTQTPPRYQPFGSTTQAPRYQPFGSTTQASRYQPFGSTTQAARYQPFGSTTQAPRFQPFRPFQSTTPTSSVSDGKYRGGNNVNPYQYQGGAQGTRAYQSPTGSGAGGRVVQIPSTTYRPTHLNTFGAQPAVGPTGAPYARRFAYNNEGQWRIFRDNKHLDQDGYAYEYETENKIAAAEQGRIYNRGTNAEVMKTSGFYEYIGDDGIKYRVDYIADENGFQPVGAHIPTVPPAIQRALNYIAAKNRQ